MICPLYVEKQLCFKSTQNDSHDSVVHLDRAKLMCVVEDVTRGIETTRKERERESKRKIENKATGVNTDLR